MRCERVFVTDTGHGDIWELLVHFYVGRPCVSDIMRGAESGTGHPVVEGEEDYSVWRVGEIGLLSSR